MALIEVTTSARVKAVLKIGDTDTTEDAWIASSIQSVSQRFELFLDRAMETVERTEEYDVHSGRQETVFLRTYPVTAISSIKNSTDWEFATATALDSDNYHLDSDNGQVHFRTELATGPKALQVVYTGGLAADTSSLITAYPLIATLADEQIAAMYRRRKSPQGQSTSSGGASVSHEGPLKLIPDVVEGLGPMRRLRFGV